MRQSGFPKIKKPAPGIPGTVLQEPDSIAKAVHHLQAEMLKFLRAAVGCHPQILPVVQTEHYHKAFRVHPLVAVLDKHLKGLLGGQLDKSLHIIEGAEYNIEFLHRSSSMLYKTRIIVYNKEKLLWIPFGM
jgi:hypothetical protein